MGLTIHKKSTAKTPAIADILTSFDMGDRRIRKFWLLLLCTHISCFLWLLYFSWIAGLLAAQDLHRESLKSSHSAPNSLSCLRYIDVFLALATGCAFDAASVALDFNRFLIQQFHYFISLRMVMLAMMIAVSFPLTMESRRPGLVTCVCCSIYASFIVITDRLHRLFSGRRVSARHGSMSEFVKHVSSVDLSWTRALVAAISNLLLYLSLVKSVPSTWSPLIPVVQIACEPVFHHLVGADKTPRYNMLVAPLLHASNCFEWGLRQVVGVPRLTMAPATYLGLILVGRLLQDLHLLTVFRHRKDLHWARGNILLPTRTLVCFLAGMLLVEYAGVPIVTYIKPIVVICMDCVGFLPHIVPSSYAIAFDKVKPTRL